MLTSILLVIISIVIIIGVFIAICDWGKYHNGWQRPMLNGESSVDDQGSQGNDEQSRENHTGRNVLLIIIIVIIIVIAGSWVAGYIKGSRDFNNGINLMSYSLKVNNMINPIFRKGYEYYFDSNTDIAIRYMNPRNF